MRLRRNMVLTVCVFRFAKRAVSYYFSRCKEDFWVWLFAQNGLGSCEIGFLIIDAFNSRRHAEVCAVFDGHGDEIFAFDRNGRLCDRVRRSAVLESRVDIIQKLNARVVA